MARSHRKGGSTRRDFLRRGSLLAAGGLAAPTLMAPRIVFGTEYNIESENVVWADYGGTTRAASVAAWMEPFQAATDVEFLLADADPAKFQLFSERQEAEWDLINLDGWDVVRFADAGMLEELPDWVTKSDLVPEKYQKFAGSGYSASVGIGYPTDNDAPVPESWADFWDVERFPGKRGLPAFAFLQAEIALLADGVPRDQIYPLDLDRAFAKLDEIREHVLFWNTFGQGMQYLAQGSVAMDFNTNSRVTIFKDQGLPIDYQWNEAVLLGWVGYPVLKYSPNPDAAFALSDFMAQPENQAQFSRLTRYGPTNSAALDLLDDATLAALPNTPERRDMAMTVDMEILAGQIDEFTRRWNEWTAL